MIAKVFAVVRGENDKGPLPLAGALERVEDLADPMVDERNARVVVRTHDPQCRQGNARRRPFEPVLDPSPVVEVIEFIDAANRVGHVERIVHAVPRSRRIEWRMWLDE
jgi:hypothetical protein